MALVMSVVVMARRLMGSAERVAEALAVGLAEESAEGLAVPEASPVSPLPEAVSLGVGLCVGAGGRVTPAAAAEAVTEAATRSFCTAAGLSLPSSVR